MEARRLRAGDYRAVRRLYLEAFPAAERFPFGPLWLVSRSQRAVDLSGWFEGQRLAAMSCTVDTGRYLYLAFLAVTPDQRSRGLGGAILRDLRRRYPGRAVILEVEPPDENAPNRLQRQKRMAFYLRNGFVDLDREITGGGVTYRLLSTDPTFDREEYQKIFRLLRLRWLLRLRRLDELAHPENYTQ